MFAEELEEQPTEITNQDLHLKHGVISTFATQSSTPTNFNVTQQSSFVKFVQTPKTCEDISLQVEIFSDNAQLLRIAVEQYLKIWFGQNFSEILKGMPTNIHSQNNSLEYEDQESIYELIVTKNQLLSNETQIKISNYTQQYQQISSLFRQLKLLLGSRLTQQFAFIMANLLILKIDSYKKLQDHPILEIIPQIQRFGGDEGQQELLPNGWQIYEDMDHATIKKFAVDKIEQIAAQLYYASELKYLNLFQVEVNSNVASAKFCGLVCLFAQTLFLTMSGMRQQNQDLQEFLQWLKIDMSPGQVQRFMTSLPQKIQNNNEQF